MGTVITLSVLLGMQCLLPWVYGDAAKDSKDWLTQLKYQLTAQDAYCMHWDDPQDPRYTVLSYVVLPSSKDRDNGFELFVFTANAMFIVNYTHPPFQVSHSYHFYELAHELPNALYWTISTVPTIFTVIGLQVNKNEDIFVFGVNRGKEYYYYNMYRNILNPWWEVNPAMELNVHLTNTSTELVGRHHHDHVIRVTKDRIVTHAQYFFHIQQKAWCRQKGTSNTPCVFNKTTNHIHPVIDTNTMETGQEIRLWKYSPPHLDTIQQERYYIYKFVDTQDNKTTWLFHRGKWQEPGNFQEDTNAVEFLHNGYIVEENLYMTLGVHIVQYSFVWAEEKNGYYVEWQHMTQSKNLIQCNMTWSDNYAQQFILFWIILCMLGILLLTLVRSFVNSHRVAYRYLLDPFTGKTIQVTDHMVVKAKQA